MEPTAQCRTARFGVFEAALGDQENALVTLNRSYEN
jgi:hypothetical protein